jgi:hypothetical protein
LGEATESVTVSADAMTLQTENADHGLVIDQKRVMELPLNARNPFMLAMLSPGVNFSGNQIYQRPFDNGAIADWTVNGGTGWLIETNGDLSTANWSTNVPWASVLDASHFHADLTNPPPGKLFFRLVRPQ